MGGGTPAHPAGDLRHFVFARRDNDTTYAAERSAIIGSAASMPETNAPWYVIATAAPSCAKRFAIAAPIPRDPPVTNATLPVSFFVSTSGCIVVLHDCNGLSFVYTASDTVTMMMGREKKF
jgi:hypothetical protein